MLRSPHIMAAHPPSVPAPFLGPFRKHLPVLIGLLVACFATTAAAETVSLILIDGDMRANWPDRGVIGFHRQDTATALTVNFTLGGTATLNTEYSATAATAVTIPAGDHEAWVEFSPTAPTLSAT